MSLPNTPLTVYVDGVPASLAHALTSTWQHIVLMRTGTDTWMVDVTAQPTRRDMQRLFAASGESNDPEKDILNWDHDDEAARYLARQERLTRGLRVVEEAHE